MRASSTGSAFAGLNWWTRKSISTRTWPTWSGCWRRTRTGTTASGSSSPTASSAWRGTWRPSTRSSGSRGDTGSWCSSTIPMESARAAAPGGGLRWVASRRQKSRPYTFSNSLPPPIVYGAAAAFDLLVKNRSIVARLRENTEYFRARIKALGFRILDGTHPIVPVMLGEAAVAQEMSAALLKAGVFVKGLWFPVVPQGEARLRAQIPAAHPRRHLDRALEAFERVGKKMNVLTKD